MESFSKAHVLIFPIPLQGHINPMMLLARKLASTCTMVTFLHTERSLSMLININNMDDDKENHPYFKMQVLPNPSHDNNLSPSSAALRFLTNQSLYRSKLEEMMRAFVEKGQPVTCIISDSFLPWTQDVANEFGIPRIEFWSSSVTVYSMGYHIPELINNGYLPLQDSSQDYCIDIIPGLETFRLADFFYDIDSTSISSPLFDIVCNAFSRGKEASKVIVNSFYHLESNVIDAMRVEGVMVDAMGPVLNGRSSETMSMMTKATVPVLNERTKFNNGKNQWNTNMEKDNMELLRPSSLPTTLSTSPVVKDGDCMNWLDGQQTGSVIYAAFGSMVTLDVEEVRELAMGLEAGGTPFLMVVRPGMAMARSDSGEGQATGHRRGQCLYKCEGQCHGQGQCHGHGQGQGHGQGHGHGECHGHCHGHGQGHGQGLDGDGCGCGCGCEEDGVKMMARLLPMGFEERVRGRGKICEWAPQVEVLRHKAIGGFVSHCGWNSAMESICAGVPMIGCPRESEQRTNLKCLRRWNLAIAMHHDPAAPPPRASSLERITRDLVCGSIRRLMQEEEGRAIRNSVMDFHNRFLSSSSSSPLLSVGDILHSQMPFHPKMA